MREQHPRPQSTSWSHRKPWAQAGGAGRSPRGLGEDTGSQAASRLLLPTRSPSSPPAPRCSPHVSISYPLTAPAAPPLPPPPPPLLCEIKVKKNIISCALLQGTTWASGSRVGMEPESQAVNSASPELPQDGVSAASALP